MLKPANIVPTEETNVMYMPAKIVGTVLNGLWIHQGFRYKSTRLLELWPHDNPQPNEQVLYWKKRFESDGYPEMRFDLYSKIEFKADPEGIYAYAKQFFGPTLDRDYAAEQAENLRVVMEENDWVLAQIDAKKKKGGVK